MGMPCVEFVGSHARIAGMRGCGRDLGARLCRCVRHTIGSFAVPDVIHHAPGLPKTRSGKIMRRILRKIATGQHDNLGDVSTLADPSVVAVLVQLKPVKSKL